MKFLSIFGLWAVACTNLAAADTEGGIRDYELFPQSRQRPEGAPSPFDAALFRDDVVVINTMADLTSLQEEYGNDTRIEEVNGHAILVHHNDSTHIATIEGQALDDLVQRSCYTDGGDDSDAGKLGKRSRCSSHTCLALRHCREKRCTQCILFWCA